MLYHAKRSVRQFSDTGSAGNIRRARLRGFQNRKPPTGNAAVKDGGQRIQVGTGTYPVRRAGANLRGGISFFLTVVQGGLVPQIPERVNRVEIDQADALTLAVACQ